MNKVYKTVLAAAVTAIVAGATITSANVLAWGDSGNGRPVYTIEQINAGKLGNTITFNSITNGKIGDERNFVGAKLVNSNSATYNADDITVKDGDVLTVRLYVHNNSPKGTAAVAKDVKASFSLPTTVGKKQTIIGYIDSSNATPNRYWDEVYLNSSEDFYIEYVKGSAKYTNAKLGTVALADSIVTSGSTIGYDALNGKIPGCYEYDGEVTIQVKVHKSVTTKLSKTVRIKGTKEWGEVVNAKVGDEVEFQIEFKNLTADQVNNVMIRDVLPTNMEYVKGSTVLYNSNYQNGVAVKDDTVTTDGINIGNYGAKGNAYVRFTAKVISKTLACGDNQLVNWASATVNSAVFKDDASVMVNRNDESCKKPTPTPTPDPDPEKPKEIINTGATEVAGAALGAGSVVTTLGYFIASRKKLM